MPPQLQGLYAECSLSPLRKPPGEHPGKPYARLSNEADGIRQGLGMRAPSRPGGVAAPR